MLSGGVVGGGGCFRFIAGLDNIIEFLMHFKEHKAVCPITAWGFAPVVSWKTAGQFPSPWDLSRRTSQHKVKSFALTMFQPRHGCVWLGKKRKKKKRQLSDYHLRINVVRVITLHPKSINSRAEEAEDIYCPHKIPVDLHLRYKRLSLFFDCCFLRIWATMF